jgi:hypothetical protein
MKTYTLILFFIISGCKTLSTSSINKIDFEMHAEKQNISSFEVLENIESYRPQSFNDATRNPFMKKRYIFKNNE